MQLLGAGEAHRPPMGRQALEEEDRLVEMGKRSVGVDLFAEQRNAGLRHVLRRIPAKLRKLWRLLSAPDHRRGGRIRDARHRCPPESETAQTFLVGLTGLRLC